MQQPNVENVVIGGAVKISLAVLNDSGLPADPPTLRLRVKAPDGQVSVYVFGVGAVISKASVGNYAASIIMTQSGNWAYRWESDAPNAGAEEGRIVVKKSIVI